MTTPSYDLRTTAKTKGNRTYLNPRYAILMKLGYLVLFLDIIVFSSFSALGFYKKWQADEFQREIVQKQEQIKQQESMLWFFDWREKTLPMQSLLIHFFKQLPGETKLSELSFELAPDGRTVNMSIAINSDKNTSAKFFREISAFLEEVGMEVRSIEQTQRVGATVFQTTMSIDHSRLKLSQQKTMEALLRSMVMLTPQNGETKAVVK